MLLRGWRKPSISQPALHMTEEHFPFVEGALAHLALGIPGEGAANGVGEEGYGCRITEA